MTTDAPRLAHLARRAGLWYGLAGSGAPFAYLYVPGALLVSGDPVATVERVRSAEGLLRAAIVGEVCGATLLVFAALALYELFRGVDRRLAALTAAMILVSVPISYVNALTHVAPLLLVKSNNLATALGPVPTAGLVTLSLQLHNYGLILNQIFWGAWLIPIGILVRRSGFFPRWLAIPLFLAGGGYVAHSLGTLILPPGLRWLTGSLQMLGVGEMPFFSFYLWIWGVRGVRVDRLTVALVLATFAIGIAGVGALMAHRIDASAYAAFSTVSLAAVIGVVLRWRRLEATGS